MVSRDLTVKINSTEMIKGYLADWLGYRQPFKRLTQEQLLSRNLSKFNAHDRGNMKKLFFNKHASDHLSRMSGTFFNFDVDIVGHLESFKPDWQNKIVSAYPILQNFVFNVNTGHHRTSVNHPSVKNRRKQHLKDPQRTRHFYKLLLKSDLKVLRALCRMVLIDYVCFPEYSLPSECRDMNNDVLKVRQLLSVTNSDSNTQ